MGDDLYSRFLMAGDDLRDELLLNGSHVQFFEGRFGKLGYAQLVEIAQKRTRLRSSCHLGSHDCSIIFVPGIMGSVLRSVVGSGVWWLDAARTLGQLNLLALDSSGTQVSDRRRHVEPCEIDFCYNAFTLAAFEEFGFPITKFPYDWRLPLQESAKRLRDLVNLEWESNGRKPIHIVAHSMGGLVVRSMLQQFGREQNIINKIGKIVFIATPHYGSTSIVYYIREHIRGTWAMWSLGKYLTRSTFRSLWGAMQLLPAPCGVYPGSRDKEAHPCVNFDLFSASAWNIDLSPSEANDFQRVLNCSRIFHEDLYTSHLRLGSAILDRMATIIGVGEEMPFRVEIRTGTFYGSSTTTELSRMSDNVHRDSDGSVSVASAQLEGIREIRYIPGKHTALPNIEAVYKDVFSFLRGKIMSLATTPQAALAGHLAGESLSSVLSAIDKSENATDPNEDMSRRWRICKPSGAEEAVLDAKIRQGIYCDFNNVKIL
jgi:pimeloyl-ACP methyl ester carboxylesterase